jgi:hypothetical protein
MSFNCAEAHSDVSDSFETQLLSAKSQHFAVIHNCIPPPKIFVRKSKTAQPIEAPSQMKPMVNVESIESDLKFQNGINLIEKSCRNEEFSFLQASLLLNE